MFEDSLYEMLYSCVTLEGVVLSQMREGPGVQYSQGFIYIISPVCRLCDRLARRASVLHAAAAVHLITVGLGNTKTSQNLNKSH